MLSKIEEAFGKPDAIDSITNEINSRLSNEMSAYRESIATIEKNIKNVDMQIGNTFLAFSKGLDPELCNERQKKYKEDKLNLLAKLNELKKNQPQALTIDSKKAHDYFNNHKTIFESGTNEQKRQMFRTYIRNLVLDCETQQVKVTLYPYYLDEKIKRENEFPRYISSGVGDGT